MEKSRRSRSPRKLKSSSFCIPRFRSSNTNKNNNNNKSTVTILSPMTLLDRFREAVLRLIMLSALSKSTVTNHSPKSTATLQRYYYPTNDPRHSEAVADCIEFIKKKSLSEEDQSRTTEVIIPVPVM